MKLFLALAFVVGAAAWEDLGSWTDDSWKMEDGKISVRLPKVEGDATKLKEAPKIQWWPTSNTKAQGAKSYTMMQDKDKQFYLVFSKKEMKGTAMPEKDDDVAMFAYKEASQSLERDDSGKEFVNFELVQQFTSNPEEKKEVEKKDEPKPAEKKDETKPAAEKKDETKKATKKDAKKDKEPEKKESTDKKKTKEEKSAMSLEREEEKRMFPFLPFMGPMMAMAAPFAFAHFAFGPHMLAAAAVGAPASLERESMSLERDVAVEKGLERERIFPGMWGVFPWMAMGPWALGGAAMMLPAAMAGF